MNKIDLKNMDNIKFAGNNGNLLERMTILAPKYNRLTDVQKLLESDGISESEFIESADFLAEEGYIRLRTIADHCPAMLSDCEYEDLEGKLTGKGKRLLSGNIKDGLVEV